MDQRGFAKIIIIVIVVMLVGAGVYFVLNRQLSLSLPSSEITNFEECARAGYTVGESYPRQCWTPDGKHFVEAIKQGLPPTPGPVTISGEITCLPKKGSGQQTMECALGLRGADGRHYGLKNLFQHDPEYKLSQPGLHVKVSGVFNPEEISGPDGNKYDVVGTIDVTSIKEVVDGGRVNENDIVSRKKDLIESEYPEFKSFEDQKSFAGQSIKVVEDDNDHYFAYVVRGSGLPIIRASCFRVDKSSRVFKVGEFPYPADSYAGYRDINPKNCSGIK